jgi:hypothetical protein
VQHSLPVLDPCSDQRLLSVREESEVDGALIWRRYSLPTTRKNAKQLAVSKRFISASIKVVLALVYQLSEQPHTSLPRSFSSLRHALLPSEPARCCCYPQRRCIAGRPSHHRRERTWRCLHALQASNLDLQQLFGKAEDPQRRVSCVPSELAMSDTIPMTATPRERRSRRPRRPTLQRTEPPTRCISRTLATLPLRPSRPSSTRLPPRTTTTLRCTAVQTTTSTASVQEGTSTLGFSITITRRRRPLDRSSELMAP